jgi:hypothetical protein
MALVKFDTFGGQGHDVALREHFMSERRRDQERHHHKQIWTKQPHGGPYVKVINTLLGYTRIQGCEVSKIEKRSGIGLR